jgi:regulator of replication initiation timing
VNRDQQIAEGLAAIAALRAKIEPFVEEVTRLTAEVRKLEEERAHELVEKLNDKEPDIALLVRLTGPEFAQVSLPDMNRITQVIHEHFDMALVGETEAGGQGRLSIKIDPRDPKSFQKNLHGVVAFAKVLTPSVDEDAPEDGEWIKFGIFDHTLMSNYKLLVKPQQRDGNWHCRITRRYGADTDFTNLYDAMRHIASYHWYGDTAESDID